MNCSFNCVSAIGVFMEKIKVIQRIMNSCFRSNYSFRLSSEKAGINDCTENCANVHSFLCNLVRTVLNIKVRVSELTRVATPYL